MTRTAQPTMIAAIQAKRTAASELRSMESATSLRVSHASARQNSPIANRTSASWTAMKYWVICGELRSRRAPVKAPAKDNQANPQRTEFRRLRPASVDSVSDIEEAAAAHRSKDRSA